jgi:hypothetical protein
MKPDYPIIECLPILQLDGTIVYEPISSHEKLLRQQIFEHISNPSKGGWFGYDLAEEETET